MVLVAECTWFRVLAEAAAFGANMKNKQETRNTEIPVTVNYLDTLDNSIGRLIPYNLNPQASFIYDMMRAGYVFEIVPTILDGELIGVSILAGTARLDENLKKQIEENKNGWIYKTNNARSRSPSGRNVWEIR